MSRLHWRCGRGREEEEVGNLDLGINNVTPSRSFLRRLEDLATFADFRRVPTNFTHDTSGPESSIRNKGAFEAVPSPVHVLRLVICETWSSAADMILYISHASIFERQVTFTE